MQIQENTSINWSKRQVINKLYVDNSVKVQVDQGDTTKVKSGRGVNTKMLFATAIPFDLDTKYPSKETLEEFGDFRIGRQII